MLFVRNSVLSFLPELFSGVMNESLPISALICLESIALGHAGLTKFLGSHGIDYNTGVLIPSAECASSARKLHIYAAQLNKPGGYFESRKISIVSSNKLYLFIPSH